MRPLPGVRVVMEQNSVDCLPGPWSSTSVEYSVDAGARQRTDGPDAVRGSEDHRVQLHRVDPEVEQRPAAKLRAQEAVTGGYGLTVVGDHEPDLAEDPVVHERADHRRLRQVPAPHPLHHQHAGFATRCDQLLRLRPVHRQRLLDQHVLACRDG